MDMGGPPIPPGPGYLNPSDIAQHVARPTRGKSENEMCTNTKHNWRGNPSVSVASSLGREQVVTLPGETDGIS